MSAITSFNGKYRFLSNFWPAKVTLDGESYPTVEHAFQAAKTDDPIVRAAIRTAKRPGDAKRLGRRLALVPGWDAVKTAVMENLLRQKFTEPFLRHHLVATADIELIEVNTWGDKFWGAVVRPQSGNPCPPLVGSNHLGKLLMKIRKELQQP